MKKFLLTTATTFLMFFNQAYAFELADLEGSWGEQDADGAYFIFDKKGNWESFYASGATEDTGIAKIKNNEVELIPNPKEDPLDETKQIKRDSFKLKISASGNALGTFERYVKLDKNHPFISMMIIDPDKNGTNVRKTPNGKIIGKIPYINPNDQGKVIGNRIVELKAQRGDWFLVGFGNNQSKEGYVHKSMIGSCATSNYTGDAIFKDIKGKSIIISKKLVKLEAITRSRHQEEVKVSVIDKNNKKLVNWLHFDHLENNPTYCNAWK